MPDYSKRHIAPEERAARRRSLLEKLHAAFGAKEFAPSDVILRGPELRRAIEFIGGGKGCSDAAYVHMIARVLSGLKGVLIDGLMLVELAEKRWQMRASRSAPIVTGFRPDNDGRIVEDVLRDRSGDVITDAPRPAAPPAQPAGTAPAPCPSIPPWSQRGEFAPRDRSEWNAWQERRGATHRQSSGRGDVPYVGGENWFLTACEARNNRE